MKKKLLFLITFFLVLNGNAILCMKKRAVVKRVQLSEMFEKCVENDDEIKQLIEKNKKNKKTLYNINYKVFSLKRDISLLKCCSMLCCCLSCGLPFLGYLGDSSQNILSKVPPL